MRPIEPGIAIPPAIEPSAAPATPADAPLRVGTYNLAGGNDHYNDAGQIGSTTRTLAAQLVGGVDAVALQEVIVATDRTAETLPEGIDDYNAFALAQVSAEAQGLQGPVQYTALRTVDGSGQQVTVIYGVDAAGRDSQVTITEEHYTADGSRMPIDLGGIGIPALDTPVTVYSADVVTPDGVQDYTAVFSASTGRDGGDYGNAMLLGPRATLHRDADGNAIVQRHVLGEDPVSGETRTALQVGIQTGDTAATLFSAHLTHDGNADATDNEQAREKQVDRLGALVDAAGDNTVLLGDFNDERFQSVGALSGRTNSENRVDPRVKTVSDHVNGRDDTNIDRIYVSGDVAASGRDELIYDGGSDHELVTWKIDLDA